MRNSDFLFALASQDTEACLIWNRGTDGSGYPKVWYMGRNHGGHRLVVVGGPIFNSEIHVRHSCDTPRCVNPKHLVPGTQQDNITDMLNKGRGVNLRGTRHGRAVHTEDEVREIKRKYSVGGQIADIARHHQMPYNSSWYADSDRFNIAMGSPSEHQWNGIICPGCFVQLHEQATDLITTWTLVPAPNHPFRFRDSPP